MIEKGTLNFILIEAETSRDELHARKISRRKSSEICLKEDPESCMEKAVLSRSRKVQEKALLEQELGFLETTLNN
jgi:hypothetical protein